MRWCCMEDLKRIEDRTDIWLAKAKAYGFM